MQKLDPPTTKEQGDVDTMISMMGGDLLPEVALRLLRKHNGDVDKAASALFEGDIGGSNDQVNVSQVAAPAPRAQTPLVSNTDKASPVIDLTGDDEDGQLSRALQESLMNQEPKFGPSERAPDPNWAVVPSNVETGVVMSQDDQSLSRAIEASLSYDYANEVFEELPLEEKIRKGGRPVALRPTESSLTYAALILHGLFHVPQVRQVISRCRPPPAVPEDSGEIQAVHLPTSGPDLMIWSLLEIFANMDIVLISELNVDAAIRTFTAEHWSTPVERPGDVSFSFYSRLTWSVEYAFHRELGAESPPPTGARLFHFRYGLSDADLSQAPFDRRIDLSVVKVDIRGTEDANDLVSCLSAELGLTGPNTNTMKQQVIFEPSDVVAFQLMRDNAPPSYAASSSTGGRVERTTFRYPKHVYLDQFMKDNLALANEKREKQYQIYAEVERLVAKKNSLMRYNDRDTLTDIRSSLHYYEHVAEHDDDPERKSVIHNTALKLRKVLTRIENELQTIDATIINLKAEAAHSFECPELQQLRYDLRVVLVHDGLYGRSHLYSYVKQKDTWWKTLDYEVTEVTEETVLSDPAGLHLGAGPYFLIYSRALSEEEEHMRAAWPEHLKNSIKHNNQMFLSQISPEAAARVSDPNSPPSSPYRSATPSEYTMSSDTVEPPLSREEPMDLAE